VPRHADPELEQRILNAARKLWKRGGEHALTMRAVAKEAGTTTPTVYERFRDRKQILEALCVETRKMLFAGMKGATSAPDACERYLTFAQAHPLEFQLLSAGWSKPPSANEQWPSFTLLKDILAKTYGGKAEDYQKMALAVWAIAHGTALLTVVGNTGKKLQTEMRSACLEAVMAMGKTMARN